MPVHYLSSLLPYIASLQVAIMYLASFPGLFVNIPVSTTLLCRPVHVQHRATGLDLSMLFPFTFHLFPIIYNRIMHSPFSHHFLLHNMQLHAQYSSSSITFQCDTPERSFEFQCPTIALNSSTSQLIFIALPEIESLAASPQAFPLQFISP